MTQLKARPSGLERVMGCAGSLLAESTCPPSPDTKYNKRGTRLHEGMALIFRIGFKAAIEKLSATWAQGYEKGWLGYHTTWDEDLKQLTEAHLAATQVLPMGAKLAIELPLNLDGLGMTGGKPDLMAVAGVQGAVIDWKFGSGSVPDPKVNPQLWIYAAALVNMKPELESVSLSIVQPGAWRMEEAHREAIFTPIDLAAKVAEVKAQLQLANLPDAPKAYGAHCKWCRAQALCQTYKDGEAGVQQVKAEVKQAELAVITEGTPVEVRFAPALPDLVVVISKELTGKMTELVDRAKMIKATDQGTANTLGTIAKEIRGYIAKVDDNRKSVKAPYLAACRAIDEAPAEVLRILTEGLNYATAEVTRFIKEQEAIEAAAQKERERLHREAAEALERAKVEEAKATAAREAAEAAALKQKQELAAQVQPQQDLLSQEGQLLTPPPAMAATATAEAASRAADEQEAASRRANAEANAKALEADLTPSGGGQVKVAGFRGKATVTYSFPDLTKVPAEWVKQILVPDDRVIKALLQSGKLDEKVCAGWMTITRDTVAAGSR